MLTFVLVSRRLTTVHLTVLLDEDVGGEGGDGDLKREEGELSEAEGEREKYVDASVRV